jgi:iron complex outermembrane receptor protein
VAPYRYILTSNRGRSIDPETVTTYELGFLSANWVEGLSFDARVFREELRDYIGTVLYEDGCQNCDTAPAALGLDTHDFRIMENRGWMDIRGVDLQARFSPNDRTTLVAATSFTRAKGNAIKTRDAAGNIVRTEPMTDFIPKLTFSTLLSHRFNAGWSGSLAYYSMSDMDWPDDGDALPEYERVDLRLAKDLKLGELDSRIELLVQNALDETYKEFRHQNHFERRTYIRFKLNLD